MTSFLLLRLVRVLYQKIILTNIHEGINKDERLLSNGTFDKLSFFMDKFTFAKMKKVTPKVKGGFM